MKSNAFAQYLRDLRARQGWTQQEMANRLHLKRSTYAYYEQGGGIPRLELLNQIAEVFGVDVCEFLPQVAGGKALADTTSVQKETAASSSCVLSPTERYLLHLFRSVDAATQTLVLYTLRTKAGEKGDPHAK